MEPKARMQKLLVEIYGSAGAHTAESRLQHLIDDVDQKSLPSGTPEYFSEKDIVLITYGDSLRGNNEKPLVNMHRFASEYLKGAVSTIHFLPFFPYSSDDGFAVQDFYRIDPELGDWEDILTIGADFDLMFDYVINHFSSQNAWLSSYLAGETGYKDFAIAVDPGEDLSRVTRPRSLPLLTPFERSDGQKVHLWTTFSEDQIDFNFKSIDVLEKTIEVLLFYLASGISVVFGTALMGWLIKRFDMRTTFAFGANLVTALLINYAARKYGIFKG